ncbi:MAG: SURF1 family protein [Brachymonas sp.]|nr:SURF1 family protein [Brachymonas sp.]
MQRATFKQQLAAQILKQNEQLAATNAAWSAIDLGAFRTQDWLHRRMQLQGRWLHEHTVFLDNRPMQVQGNQRVGFYVATPLLLADSNRVIWVQRGWIARDFQDRNRLPDLPQTQAQVTVQGRVMAQVSRAYEMKNQMASAQQTSRASRIWQNLPEINFALQQPVPSQALPPQKSYQQSQTQAQTMMQLPFELMPVALLQIAPEQGNDVLLRNWATADTGVAKHHGYAFQWFALSALFLVLYVWFQLIAPRRKHRA